MIPLNVKNVYTSIPKQEVLSILKNRLTFRYKFRTNPVHEISQSINVITSIKTIK